MTHPQSHDDTKTCGDSIHSSRPCTAPTQASNNEMGGVIVFLSLEKYGIINIQVNIILPFSILRSLLFSPFGFNILYPSHSLPTTTFLAFDSNRVFLHGYLENKTHKLRRLSARYRDELSHLLYLRRRRKRRVDSLRQRGLSCPMVSLGMRWHHRAASRKLGVPAMPD